MNEDYNRGKEIGELFAEVRSLRDEISEYRKEQKSEIEKMDRRLTLAEQWIQTTTGKVVVLTFIFGLIGSVFYIGINWVVSHIK